MPLALKVQTELDERSLSDVRNQAESELGTIGAGAGRAFSGGLTSQLDNIGPSFVRLGSTAEAAMTGVAGGAAIAAAGVAGIAIAIEKAGEALYGVGARFDAVFDNMTIQTGRTGAELDALTESVKRVARDSASSFEELGDISARVSQAFSSLSGSPLDELTKNIADLNRMTSESLNVREFGQALRGFGVDGQEATAALDSIEASSQRTGIPLAEMVGTLQNVGPAARSLGLDMNQTAGLITSFEQAGLDSSRMLTGLTSASQVFADNNINLRTGLADTITQIKGFVDAGNDAGAVDLAGKVFGARSAQMFVDSIRQGTLSVQTLNAEMGGTQGTIQRMDDATADWAESWQKLKNRVSETAEEIGGPLFDVINRIGVANNETITAMLDNPASIFNPNFDIGQAARDKLKEAQDRAAASGPPPAAAPGGVGSGLGGFDPAAPGMVWGQGQDIAGALADDQKKAAEAQVPYGPGFGEPPRLGESIEQWRQRQSQLEAQHSLDEARTRQGQLPADATDADRVAANNAVLQAQNRVFTAGQSPTTASGVQVAPVLGLGAAPRPGQTAEQYGKEQSALSASQKRLQAEAELAQVQSNASSTQEELTKAQLNLTNARQAEYSAVLRLTESGKDASSSLQEIGAQLDKDLGVSKGLPGLADNLVRFIAAIGTAPAMGQLAGIRDASTDPKDAGGLVGMAAVRGAFGPQYMAQGGLPTAYQMPGPYTPGVTPSAIGPAGLQPRAVDAALLANVPAGRYTQTEGADLTQGLADCSSAVEDLVNIMDGRPTSGRSMSTGNEAEWLTQHGFAPGMGGPGDFRVGFNSGHTQATLPGGTPFNWGSDASAAQRGIGGTGADDPAFTQHFYRPVGAPGGAPGGVANQAGFNRLMQAEAGGSGGWQANTGNGYYGGLQFDQSTWQQYGGTQYAPRADLATQQQQMSIAQMAITSRGGPQTLWPQNYGLLNQGTFDEGGLLPPGTTIAQNNTGRPEMVIAGPPAGMPATASTAAPAPAMGPGMGPTQIGGVASPGVPGGSMGGGGGIAGAAAEAVGAMFPGAGVAASIAMQEISRAAKFGGQLAGIGVQGLMETFLPTGGSELANNNWLTRIGGAFAGMAPQLPNIAGKASAAMQPTMVAPPPMPPAGVHTGTGTAPGPTSNTGVHIENYNVVASEDRAGQDIARWNMPGQR